MPGTSKATLITDQSASDKDSQTPNLRPPVSLPAEHLIGLRDPGCAPSLPNTTTATCRSLSNVR